MNVRVLRSVCLSFGAALAIGFIAYGASRRVEPAFPYPAGNMVEVSPVTIGSLEGSVPADLKSLSPRGNLLACQKILDTFAPFSAVPSGVAAPHALVSPRVDIPPFTGYFAAGQAQLSPDTVLKVYPAFQSKKTVGTMGERELQGLVSEAWGPAQDDLLEVDRLDRFRSALQFMVERALHDLQRGDRNSLRDSIQTIAKFKLRLYESVGDSEELDTAISLHRLANRRLALLFAYGDKEQNEWILDAVAGSRISDESLENIIRREFHSSFVEKLSSVRFPNDLSQFLSISDNGFDEKMSMEFGRWFAGNPKPYDVVATQALAADLYRTMIDGIHREAAVASKNYSYKRSVVTGQIPIELTNSTILVQQDFANVQNVLGAVPNIFGRLIVLRSPGTIRLASQIYTVRERDDQFLKVLRAEMLKRY